MSSEKAITRSPQQTVQIRELQPQPAASASTANSWSYRPDADIFELDAEYVIVLDMPGVGPDDIDLTFENGLLTVHGRVQQRQPESWELLVHEYGVGDYFRRFALENDVIDANSIGAECVNGVLTVHLPKLESARSRRIRVTSGENR